MTRGFCAGTWATALGFGEFPRTRSLADLRGIAEGDGEEQCGNGQGQNQDVGEALHGDSSGRAYRVWRSAEGGASWGHVALRQTTGGTVAQFLE